MISYVEMKHRVFIIIELLIVVAIIGILIMVGQIMNYRIDKMPDLQKKLNNQKEYKERLYHQE